MQHNSRILEEPMTTQKASSKSTSNVYMNVKQLLHFRGLLIKWRDDLLNQAASTVDHIRYDTANYPDETDRATREEGFGLELKARNREHKLIEKIEDTLERIDNNDYGFCVECDSEIGLQRLEARPTATLCIDCKSIAEMREKQGVKQS